MSDEEILRKAIEKAVKGGFEIEGSDMDDLTWFMEGFLIENFTVNDIIFSHDFAKAFWGEEEIVKNAGAPTGYVNKDPDDSKGTWGWQHYLHYMVLEEDPIKYLEKFL